MNARRVAAPVLCVLLGSCLVGCGSDSGSPTTTPTPAPTATPTPAIPAGGAGFTYNGITHVSWSPSEYGEAAGSASRQALAATRANWAGLLVTWYMETRTASTIAPNGASSPSDDVVLRAIDELQALGLQVMLKPHVDVRDGTWRAQIAPASPAAWWASYAAFLDHYTEIAARKNVGMLCVGTELASMSGSRYSGEWASLIGRIRGQYRGLLTYAANGVDAADEFTSVSFWGRVDLMGVDVYTAAHRQQQPDAGRAGRGLAPQPERPQHGRGLPERAAGLRQAARSSPRSATAAATAPTARRGTGACRWRPTPASRPTATPRCTRSGRTEKDWMKGPFWWSWDVLAPATGRQRLQPARQARGGPAARLAVS